MYRLQCFATWWRSPESARVFWRTMVIGLGLHAVTVATAVLWVTALGPWTGLDDESAGLVPRPVLNAATGYAFVLLTTFLFATYLSGHRRMNARGRGPATISGKRVFAVSATYLAATLSIAWVRLGLPVGLETVTTPSLPPSLLTFPPLWPTYAAAVVVAQRLVRRRRPAMAML